MRVLILAGGSGTRLWPLSTHQEPKQFLSLFGEGTLLQSAARRALYITSPENVYISTNEQGSAMVSRQLSETAIPLKNIIKEPSSKNTAPAIAYALRHIIEKSPESVDEPFLICPSDHWIQERPDQWKELMKEAADLATQQKIVVFGIPPTSPETGYGYIKADSKGSISFKEKPDLDTARRYLYEGGYFWNSGMFVLTPALFFEEIKVHSPSLAQFFKSPLKNIEEGFSNLQKISIDYAIMEKTKRAILLPFKQGWSDIGSWESLYRGFTKDSSGNASQGNVKLESVSQSLILSNGKPLMAFGVNDLLIVQTHHATLVAKRGISEDKMRALAKEADDLVDNELDHTFHRPWGSYTVLAKGPKSLTKKIVVLPGKRLSLQFHHHRDEHWVIVQGVAEVTLGEETRLYSENSSVYIPKETVHRIANPGEELLEIIEVQYGDVLKEEDIERISDDFGRVAAP